MIDYRIEDKKLQIEALRYAARYTQTKIDLLEENLQHLYERITILKRELYQLETTYATRSDPNP